MGDKELIEGIKESKENALEELQIKYGRLIYGIAKDVLGKRHSNGDVEECYSDVVVTIWRNIEDFEEDKGRFINFIAAIAKFKAIDYLRKLDKRKETDINEGMLEDIHKEDVIADELEGFKELIKILSDNDRKLFIKRYYFEEEIEKIALDMNMTKDMVYKRLSRGREKLKSELEGRLCL